MDDKYISFVKNVPDGVDEEGYEFMPDWVAWKVGGKDFNDENITEIVGQNEFFIVYFVKPGWLKWQFESKTIKGAHKLEAAAQIALNQGKSWIKAKREFKEFRNIVASGMVTGLSNLQNGEDYQSALDEANAFLAQRKKSTYQLTFVLSATASVMVLGGSLVLVYLLADELSIHSNHRHLLLGASAGCYGAWLSMMIRARGIEASIEKFSSRLTIAIESVIRVGLGLSFGLLLITLQKAGLLLTIAESNVYFLSLGGVIAGFNERFIPALLAEVEKAYGSVAQKLSA